MNACEMLARLEVLKAKLTARAQTMTPLAETAAPAELHVPSAAEISAEPVDYVSAEEADGAGWAVKNSNATPQNVQKAIILPPAVDLTARYVTRPIQGRGITQISANLVTTLGVTDTPMCGYNAKRRLLWFISTNSSPFILPDFCTQTVLQGMAINIQSTGVLLTEWTHGVIVQYGWKSFGSGGDEVWVIEELYVD